VPAGRVQLHSSLAAVLGCAHGDLGLAQQVIGVLGAGDADRDPDARPNRHLPVSHPKWGLQSRGQAGARGKRLGLLGDALQEHGELITPDPRQRVRVAQTAGQATGHRGQQLVAAGVAQAVVDHAEVVQVGKQQGGQLGDMGRPAG
jgi:hypothetical protein